MGEESSTETVGKESKTETMGKESKTETMVEESKTESVVVDSPPPSPSSCFLCREPADCFCQTCFQVAACSPAHLQVHCPSTSSASSSSSSSSCLPFSILRSPTQGRYMVASRDIVRGETVLSEEPVVVGPNQEGEAVCLGCLAECGCGFMCPGCGFPVCDEECAGAASHRQECQVLARGAKHSFQEGALQEAAYHVILPLRLLLLGKKQGLVELMPEHREERMRGEYWQVAEKQIVARLRDDYGQLQWNEEEVRAAVGRLEMNAWEIHRYRGEHTGYRGLFPVIALMNHSCIQNVQLMWTKEAPFSCRVLATKDIKKGQELNVSYLTPTTCNIIRRRQLSSGWQFSCCCPRCQDPHESGAETNTMVCSSCSSPSLLPSDSLDWASVWCCQGCGREEEAKKVTETVEELLREVAGLVIEDRYNSAVWLSLRETALTVCHPRHQVLCELAMWAVPILARGPGQRLSDFPLCLVATKLSLATEYLAVLDILEAGLSRNRAKTIYEMVDTRLYLSSLEFREGAISREELSSRVKEMVGRVEEAENILQVLGVNSGYEEMVVQNLTILRGQCHTFLNRSGSAKIS